ncbi:MAG TPA: hypothetical protein VLG37_00635 [Candidatus Saccharimonadales bacterium]|nr:hypothetical protein [Candidatus Saccharimonadales bacterium]
MPNLATPDLIRYFDVRVTDGNSSPSGIWKNLVPIALEQIDGHCGVMLGGPKDPGVEVLEAMMDGYGGQSFSGTVSEAVLNDLDVIERAVRDMRYENAISLAGITIATRAISLMTYRGSRDDKGIPDIAASCERSFKAAATLAGVGSDIMAEAQSRLRVYGVRVALPGIRGEGRGTVESWGSLALYGRTGLGMSVVLETGERRIVDIGHDRFDLLV